MCVDVEPLQLLTNTTTILPVLAGSARILLKVEHNLAKHFNLRAREGDITLQHDTQAANVGQVVEKVPAGTKSVLPVRLVQDEEHYRDPKTLGHVKGDKEAQGRQKHLLKSQRVMIFYMFERRNA